MSAAEPFDLKITNARIVDGTGAAGYAGELAIRDGRIAELGEQVAGAARQTLDAQGLVLCPGFVDVHTHYDAQVFWDKTVSPSCYHGVTTVFGGHCGFSIAPLSADAAPYLLKMLARVEGMPVASLTEGVPWNWQSFAEYLGKLDGNLGVNAGFMAGHSAIRRVVMGERAVGEEASAAERRRHESAAGPVAGRRRHGVQLHNIPHAQRRRRPTGAVTPRQSGRAHGVGCRVSGTRGDVARVPARCGSLQ